MKRWISVLAPSALALGVLAGCGSSATPPAELKDARAAYQRAESGPAAQYNRAGLIETRQALDAAEREYLDSPKSDDVKTLGYVATRKAQVAEADARAAKTAGAAFATEQGMAARSERRANLALEQLGLSAKEDERGTVITLPGASMFATDQAAILPSAKGRLAEIAKAVDSVMAQQAPEDVGRRMLLVGYTDDTGSEEHNQTLSEERAEAVRAYFSKHGLDDVQIDVEGRGEADAIADNTTAQGRAQNRRVEIIISPAGSPEGGAK